MMFHFSNINLKSLLLKLMINNGLLQDLKTLKMWKDVGMAYQKVCKQGRDDIRGKVNLQSLIPASFYTSLQL